MFVLSGRILTVSALCTSISHLWRVFGSKRVHWLQAGTLLSMCCCRDVTNPRAAHSNLNSTLAATLQPNEHTQTLSAGPVFCKGEWTTMGPPPEDGAAGMCCSVAAGIIRLQPNTHCVAHAEQRWRVSYGPYPTHTECHVQAKQWQRAASDTARCRRTPCANVAQAKQRRRVSYGANPTHTVRHVQAKQ